MEEVRSILGDRGAEGNFCISTLELAHRIDRDTSGCLIMCKRRTALLEIQNAFREPKVKKIYDLYVYGEWSRKKRRVALPLLRYLAQQ